MSQPISSRLSLEARQVTAPIDDPKQSIWRSTVIEILSGGVGGAAGAALTTPFMYFKMYMQEKAKNPTSSPTFEKNPIKWFSGTTGLAGWMFPQAAFIFTMNTALRKQCSQEENRDPSRNEKLACGAITGALSTLFVAPQELIWTQQKKYEELRQKVIEEKKCSPQDVPIKNSREITKEIWRNHGIKGFYRAGGETAAREVISTVVLTYLAGEAPLLAPLLGATISQPIDGRKTHKQMDFNYKGSLKDLFKAKAFSGLATGRIPIYLIFMNTVPYVKDRVKEIMS